MSILKGERAKVVTLFGTITVPGAARSHSAYLARPDLRGEWPTVVVLTGDDVVGSPAKELCRRLARQGLAVIAPAESPSPAAREATIEFVINPTADWSNAEHGFGVLGLRAGATAAVAAAAQRPLMSALALLGAAPEATSPLPSRLPVLGLSGGGDPEASRERIDAWRAAVPRTEWVVYGGLGPDFWNDAADGWDPEAFDDAVTRLAAFFSDHLPPVYDR